MNLDPDTCYKAVASHDRRFDGRFFVGVSSTGVYCRPVCAVRTPKRENCTFYESAAAAEKHGFRPCLRCRPELAPGHGLADISGRLAQAAATLIDEGFMAEGRVATLAARIGVTERHLRRLFDAQFGVSVLEYALTQRLLLAKASPFRQVVIYSAHDWLAPLQIVWRPACVLLPGVLAGLALAGYYYSAQQAALRLLETVALVLSVLVLGGVTRRWLLVSRRRLSREQARQRRAAQLAASVDGDAAMSTAADLVEDLLTRLAPDH